MDIGPEENSGSEQLEKQPMAEEMELTMFKPNRANITTWIAGGALALLAGCSSSQTPVNHSERFDTDMQATQINTLMDTEKASGSRADSTLYPQHFDGPGLSSLGTTELDLILADSHSTNPLVIYMDVADDTYSDDRRTAVSRYLQDKGGLKPEQIKFESGVNPDTYHPVEDDLANYSRTDSSSESTPESGGASSSGAGH
jgi:hypothetical protein